MIRMPSSVLSVVAKLIEDIWEEVSKVKLAEC